MKSYTQVRNRAPLSTPSKNIRFGKCFPHFNHRLLQAFNIDLSIKCIHPKCRFLCVPSLIRNNTNQPCQQHYRIHTWFEIRTFLSGKRLRFAHVFTAGWRQSFRVGAVVSVMNMSVNFLVLFMFSSYFLA